MHPPRLARWFLERCLSPEHDAIVGDLDEEYHDHAAYYGTRKAAVRYAVQVLRTVPSILLVDLIWHRVMLKNYLLVALRSLWKNKGFSGINIAGLALAMSVCLLLILFIKELRSYDRFHGDSDRIYRVYSAYKPDTKAAPDLYATAPASLSALLRSEAPGVDVVQLRRFGGMAVVGGSHASKNLSGQGIPLGGLYAEPSFFDVFGFRLQAGDARQALAEPHSVVLSPEAATLFFGDADPVGQILSVEGQGDFIVTGLLHEAQGKSHLRFDALVSFSTLPTLAAEREALADWQQTVRRYYTFIRLAPGVSASTVREVFPDLIARHYVGDEAQYLDGLHLQPLTEINLGLNLENQLNFPMPAVAMYFLVGLGLIILLVACFNYIGLSVARALRRTREVGVRKVMGAHRFQIVRQFLVEAVLTALGALCLGGLLLFWLLPAFNSLTPIRIAEMTITPDWTDGSLYLLFLGFTVLVGIGAGLYPAVYLSAFAPVRVLKGLFISRRSSGSFLRKGLMMTQFGFSLVFIITTLLLYQQLHFMLTIDYGFEREQIINVPLQDVAYDRFRNAVQQQAQVVGVSATSDLPASARRAGTTLRHLEIEEPLEATAYAVDYHFLDNLGLALVAGRYFDEAYATDREEAAILNETAVHALGWETSREAVGKPVQLLGEATMRQVVGVVRDYQYDLPFLTIGPMVLHYTPEHFRYANIRVQPGEEEQVIAYLEAVWPTFDTVYPLRYSFFNEQLQEGPELMLFREFMSIAGLLAAFAIFIACLGLLGMVGYHIEVRVKEIGVRKVLGASVSSLILLLSKDFVRLIMVAVLITTPLAWFLNTLWLQQIGNRIDLGIAPFAVGIGGLLLVALGTLGSQALRAARVNPVDTLRHE